MGKWLCKHNELDVFKTLQKYFMHSSYLEVFSFQLSNTHFSTIWSDHWTVTKTCQPTYKIKPWIYQGAVEQVYSNLFYDIGFLILQSNVPGKPESPKQGTQSSQKRSLEFPRLTKTCIICLEEEGGFIRLASSVWRRRGDLFSSYYICLNSGHGWSRCCWGLMTRNWHRNNFHG